jgi:hypothetical protein
VVVKKSQGFLFFISGQRQSQKPARSWSFIGMYHALSVEMPFDLRRITFEVFDPHYDLSRV